MALITQIGSTSEADATALRDMLLEKSKDVDVAHPRKGGLSFSEWENPWAFYESELHLYESIATSAVHIIANHDGTLSETLALQILYAMLLHKPVILMAEPTFDESVDVFARQTLRLHQDQFAIADLAKLSDKKLAVILKAATKPTAYQLNDHEEALIKTDIRRYFRWLLEDAKDELLAVI